ncbi:MAG: AMP-binding protein [Acidobacteria bacterium]|nr:AMP-binding protein [Acidobacteriota bacterium]
MNYFPRGLSRRPALKFLDITAGTRQEFSVADLKYWIERYAGFIYQAGISPGDRVGILLENSPELIISLFGNHLLGAITVPINPLTTPVEFDYLVKKAEITGLVSNRQEDCPLRFHLHQNDFWRSIDQHGARFPRNTDRASAALLCFTSGTTARPKGVLLTHHNIISNIQDLLQVWEWSSSDRLALSLPLFHVHGLVVGLHGWALSGCTALVLSKFKAAHVLDLLSHGEATLFMGVPAMYHQMVDAFDSRQHDLSKIRLAITGSAPMPLDLHERCRKIFHQTILERYGMTETIMNLSNPANGVRKPGSVGLPLPSVRVRLMDEQTEITECERMGELWIQGPNVFSGYWSEPEATAKAFSDGWFRTGDVAYKDPDGYYYLQGRLVQDFVKSGGNRVGTREVEEVLQHHPAVKEVAVIGLPDAELGQRVAAFVVAQYNVGAEDLIHHCQKSLARYKCPREIRFVNQLPRNAMGKITKSSLG